MNHFFVQKSRIIEIKQMVISINNLLEKFNGFILFTFYSKESRFYLQKDSNLIHTKN